MKRMGIAVMALGLLACGVRAQDAPAKAPATPPAKAPAKAPAAAGQSSAASAGGLKTQKEKVSYSIGMEMGKGVKTQGIDVDVAVLTQGLKDALSGAKPQMSDEEIKQVITGLQQDIKQKQMQIQEAAGAENKKKGDEFLAANGKKDGVVTLPDGLQYKIVKAGDGKKPAETDTVLVNYTGKFIDGSEFDSSTKSGKPVPFQVKNVIPGFKEVLQLMPVGSSWQVYIPSNLGYGERGAGGVIGPNSTLVFDIEVVSIEAAQ